MRYLVDQRRNVELPVEAVQDPGELGLVPASDERVQHGEEARRVHQLGPGKGLKLTITSIYPFRKRH